MIDFLLMLTPPTLQGGKKGKGKKGKKGKEKGKEKGKKGKKGKKGDEVSVGGSSISNWHHQGVILYLARMMIQDL